MLFLIQLLELVYIGVWLYTLILIAYALLSWFPGAYQSALGRWLEKLSEPYLKHFRSLNLRIGMMDFTVAAAVLVLNFAYQLLLRLVFFLF